MNPYAKKASSAYQFSQVSTPNQVTLIIMLYEGTIRFLKQALIKIDQKDIEGSYKSISLARNIVAELIASLDLTTPHSDIAKNLSQLYRYIFVRLIEANFSKDKESINEVIGLMNNLLDGWKQVSKRNKSVGTAAAGSEHKQTNVYG